MAPNQKDIEAAFAALRSATGGEYTTEDQIVIDGLNAGNEAFARIATLERKVLTRELHIRQLVEERRGWFQKSGRKTMAEAWAEDPE